MLGTSTEQIRVYMSVFKLCWITFLLLSTFYNHQSWKNDFWFWLLLTSIESYWKKQTVIRQKKYREEMFQTHHWPMSFKVSNHRAGRSHVLGNLTRLTQDRTMVQFFIQTIALWLGSQSSFTSENSLYRNGRSSFVCDTCPDYCSLFEFSIRSVPR